MRELREETGLTAGSWLHLTDIHTTPGFSDERISLYLARDLKGGESQPDDDEFLNVVRVPLAEIVAAIMRGEITDAKTVCAVVRKIDGWEWTGKTMRFGPYGPQKGFVRSVQPVEEEDDL